MYRTRFPEHKHVMRRSSAANQSNVQRNALYYDGAAPDLFLQRHSERLHLQWRRHPHVRNPGARRLTEHRGFVATKGGYADIDFDEVLPNESGFANFGNDTAARHSRIGRSRFLGHPLGLSEDEAQHRFEVLQKKLIPYWERMEPKEVITP